MSSSLLYSLSDDFDRYCRELMMLSDRAAAFMIKDSLVRTEYLYDVSNSIKNYQVEFEREKSNPFRQGEVLQKLKDEYEIAHQEYQSLRTNNYVTYLITDVFEEHGVIKYGKMAVGVVSGGLQAVSGASLLMAGSRLHIRKFQGAGVMLIAHGANNVYESVSPLIFETAHSGVVRNIYRKAVGSVGLDKNAGDFLYSAVDFSLNVYAAVKSPVLQQSKFRLVKQYRGEKPGTGRLFYAIKQDYASKWKVKAPALKLFFYGDTIRKAVIEFPMGGYKKDF